MTYTAIDDAEIDAGEPVTTTLFGKIQDDFADHETRIEDLEAGTSVQYPPIIMRVNGPYDVLTTAAKTGVLKTTCNFNIRITGARLYIDTAGVSGTTTVDILTSHSGGAYHSIFTTKPSVLFSVGNDGVSTNAILDGTYRDIASGDIIRFDFSGVQSGANGCYLRLDYERV